MKITYMIGNGFDLNIGLKTSFSDFFKEYCNSKDHDDEVIENFKAEICNNTFAWSDFEFQMGRYAHEVEPLGTLSIQDYCNCMEDFRNEIVTYLMKEEKRINKTVFIRHGLRQSDRVSGAIYETRASEHIGRLFLEVQC